MGLRSILMPDVGEGVAEAEIVEWHVKVGDLVREDQVGRRGDDRQGDGRDPDAGRGHGALRSAARSATCSRSASELIRIDAPGLPDSAAAARRAPREGVCGRRSRRRGSRAKPAPRAAEAGAAGAAAAGACACARASAGDRRCAARRARPAKSRSPRRRCGCGRARPASTCASCAEPGRPGASPTTISTPSRPSAGRAREGPRPQPNTRGRDDQGRRHAPPHRPEHGGVVAAGRAFLLCRGGRRHRARGAARRAQRARPTRSGRSSRCCRS